MVQLYFSCVMMVFPNEHQETTYRRLQGFGYVDQVFLCPTQWMSEKSFDQTWRKINGTPSTKNPLNVPSVQKGSKHGGYPLCSTVTQCLNLWISHWISLSEENLRIISLLFQRHTRSLKNRTRGFITGDVQTQGFTNCCLIPSKSYEEQLVFEYFPRHLEF